MPSISGEAVVTSVKESLLVQTQDSDDPNVWWTNKMFTDACPQDHANAWALRDSLLRIWGNPTRVVKKTVTTTEEVLSR